MKETKIVARSWDGEGPRACLSCCLGLLIRSYSLGRRFFARASYRFGGSGTVARFLSGEFDRAWRDAALFTFDDRQAGRREERASCTACRKAWTCNFFMGPK
jgi:hypothetical protein